MIKTIKLGDTEYPFRYSVNAFVRLQEFLGIEDVFKWRDVKNLMETTEKLQDARFLRFVVWNGIKDGYDTKKEDCPIDEDQVGLEIEMNNTLFNLLIATVWGIDIEAVKKALKELPKEEKKEDKKKVLSKAGSSSGELHMAS